MQLLIGCLCILIAILVALVALAYRWWKNRSANSTSSSFQSDMPPPACAIAFNQAIVAACGPQTDAAFQLKLLTTSKEPLSVAIALRLSREEVERKLLLKAPPPVVSVAKPPAPPTTEVAKS